MKVVAIVQARMGSTRLPGKVLCDIGGRSMLARVIERLRRTVSIQEVLVATTESPRDDVIVEECNRFSVQFFRGQESDVLDRYYQAARACGADAVVRITSDCPLIDPEVTDRTVRAFLAASPDYAANTLKRTYPRGLDTEVMTAGALEQAWRETSQSYERVHVTPYLYQHPEKFRLLSVEGSSDCSEYRWTVDTPEDLHLVRTIYERLGSRGNFSWQDVLDLVKRSPELPELNRSVKQKALCEG